MAATTAVLATTAIAAGTAAYSANQQNKARKEQMGLAGSVPQGPDMEEAYERGVETDLKYAPLFAAQEEKLRQQYLPGRAHQAMQLYKKYLPQTAVVNLAALKKVDPEFLSARTQLHGNVSRDLALGTKLDPEFEAQVGQYIRAAQAARGNVLGAGPIGAEALAKGEAGMRMYQQRIGNVQDFIRAPGPTDKFSGLVGAGGPMLGQATTAPLAPGFGFVDRNAGQQGILTAQQAYGNTLSGWRTSAALQTGAPEQANPWMAALGGAVGSIGTAAKAYQAFQPRTGTTG